MRKRSTAVAAVIAMVVVVATSTLAQNGKSTTGQGSTPNGRPFQALQSQMAAIEQQLSALDAIEAQIDALARQVAENAASIEDLRTYDALLDARISSLGGAVLALETAMAGLEDDVQALQLHDAIADQWLAALEQRADEAEARLDEHAGELQALVDADSALQEYAAALLLEINFLKSQTQGATADLTSLQQELADVRAELNAKQNLIVGSCPAGSSIRQIDSAGGVICELDDAGAGGGGGASTIVLTDPFNASVVVPAAAIGYGFVSCPSGYLPLSAGYSVPTYLNVFYSVPAGSFGWMVGAYNPSGTTTTMYVTVRCGKLS